MNRAAVAGLALMAGGLARAADRPEVRPIEGAKAAVVKVLGERPRVVAFGEYHETRGAAKVPSAIRRFTEEMLPGLAGRASDLVVETWITEGSCGTEEKQVTADVEQTTQRPETTESEVVTLIKRAKALGIEPHILTLTCAEYRSLVPDGGAVDYVRLLGLVTVKLEAKVRALVAARPAAALIAVYGGAMHNDLYPRAELAEFSFGRRLRGSLGARYLEIDLYVPEFIEEDAELRKQAWFPAWRRLERPGRAIWVRRGPGSYILLFAPSPPLVAPPPAPAPVPPPAPAPPSAPAPASVPARD